MTEFTVEHCLLEESAVAPMLEGRRITSGGRTMGIKEQVVADFLLSVRVPGYFPSMEELRQQMHALVTYLDEPCPPLARREDIKVGGAVGDLPARVYAATEGEPLPVLVFYHGGGFVQGDLETHDGLCGRLAQWSGAMVVAVDYRLAPEHPFPAGVEDAVAAYAWARENAASIGGDATRVAVGGDSAGGNLSAVVCHAARRQGLVQPYAQLLIYPAVDTDIERYPSHEEMKEGPVIPRDRLEFYFEKYLGGQEVEDTRLSPLLEKDFSGLAPAMVLVGAFDPLRDEGIAYARKLAEAGVDVVTHEMAGQIHACFNMAKALPAALQETRAMADWLARVFSPSLP